ncbi:SIS domain-containing protein [Nocardioides sp.]|uniref:SIS domain-containing protein n=1 Tax=Nocardioides sp. TaxID=35761 RepID=UPI002626D3DA|nr:SIS domain-containing protein [Nocardioides sp.]MDI6909194.1 SIS domain-containing protein [Nocardioides sp.]
MRFPEGIDAQPEVLRTSAAAVRDALRRIPPIAEGAVVALVGIGASEHVARSAAPVWRASGIRAFALSATELLDADRPVADVVVAMSESGRSTETVTALERTTGRRVAITNFPDSPLADVVDEVIPLDSGPDSPVYTTGYTATIQAIGLLGEHWAGARTDWSALPDQAAQVIASARPVVESVAERFDRARLIDVIGSGASITTAGEGALLLREAARALTAAHETHNYLHGPMEPLDPSVCCVVIGAGREVRLAREVSALGCATLLVTTDADIDAAEHLVPVRLPVPGSPLARTVLEILPLQLLGWSLASRRGLRADGFRYEQDDIKLGSR